MALAESLTIIEKTNPISNASEFLDTIIRIITNIVANPNDMRFRRLKISNVQTKFASIQNSTTLFNAIGFRIDSDNNTFMTLADDNVPLLNGLLQLLQSTFVQWKQAVAKAEVEVKARAETKAREQTRIQEALRIAKEEEAREKARCEEQSMALARQLQLEDEREEAEKKKKRQKEADQATEQYLNQLKAQREQQQRETEEKDKKIIEMMIQEEEKKLRAQKQAQSVEDQRTAATMAEQQLNALYLTNQPFTCESCMEDFASELKSVKPDILPHIQQAVKLTCSHSMCQTCFIAMVKAGAEQKQQPKCMKMGCRKLIHPPIIGKFCGADVLEKFDKAMVESVVLTSGQGKQCTTANCKGMGFVEKNQKDYLCNLCNKVNCIPCNIVHQGITCEKYQEWRKLNDKANALTEQMIAADPNYKRCPGCKHVTVKLDGCNYVVCSACKQPWCWQTAKLRSQCGGGHGCH